MYWLATGQALFVFIYHSSRGWPRSHPHKGLFVSLRCWQTISRKLSALNQDKRRPTLDTKCSILEKALKSALTKYTVKLLVYVSTTNIYLEYTGYMFRPVNRSSSGHQSKKSKVLLTYWFPNIYNYIQHKIWYWLKYIVKLKPLKHDKNKLTNTRQHNKRLLEYTGYMFRPVNKSSSDLQQSKSQVIF